MTAVVDLAVVALVVLNVLGKRWFLTLILGSSAVAQPANWNS